MTMLIKSLSACLFLLQTGKAWGEVNHQPPVIASENGTIEVILDIEMVTSLNGTRFSPQYNGGPIGPTLRVKPGDLMTVIINNNLDPSPPRDIELLTYIQDPQNEEDNMVNVTKIFNRLSPIGNIWEPEFGFWGFSLANVHFHGAGFSPSAEDLLHPVDGGESRTYQYRIPDDHPPGLVWYHNHVHGLGTYSMMSGLYGAMIIEGTANDVTAIPEVAAATEVVMMMAESLKDAETGIPMPFFPIVMSFDWDSVVNGILAEENMYEFTQGETVLFRAVSASVEPMITLYFNEESAPEFLILSEDGFPVPEVSTTQEIDIIAGSRVDFMVKFDQPGTYSLRRKPWNIGITGIEMCNISFGIPAPSCISYDIDQLIATITVLESDTPIEAELPTEAPEYPQIYKNMEDMPVANTRTIHMQQRPGFPIFQIPYDGPFVPPGIGFGINDRLFTPHYSHGDIVAGTCEEWVVDQIPPGEHSFHIHTNPFLVTHLDGIPVEEPFWRDTFELTGYNMTIKTCFNHLEPGEMVMVHCHQLVHQDIGMAANFMVVEESGIQNETIPEGDMLEQNETIAEDDKLEQNETIAEDEMLDDLDEPAVVGKTGPESEVEPESGAESTPLPFSTFGVVAGLTLFVMASHTP